MKQPGIRVVAPKVIGLDKPYDGLITLPLQEVGIDLKIAPSDQGASIKIIGKNPKSLEMSLTSLKSMAADILARLNISNQYTIEVKSFYPTTEPEILATLLEGFWKIARPDKLVKEIEIQQLTKKWDLSHWNKQVFYTALEGGMRISQYPFQENGFRLNLPRGFRIVLFPAQLNNPFQLNQLQKSKAYNPDTRVLIAALSAGSLYSNIPRIKFGLSGTNNQTPFNIISFGQNTIPLPGASDQEILNYALFKNSTEAKDFAAELRKSNKDNDSFKKITVTEIASEGARVL